MNTEAQSLIQRTVNKHKALKLQNENDMEYDDENTAALPFQQAVASPSNNNISITKMLQQASDNFATSDFSSPASKPLQSSLVQTVTPTSPGDFQLNLAVEELQQNIAKIQYHTNAALKQTVKITPTVASKLEQVMLEKKRRLAGSLQQHWNNAPYTTPSDNNNSALTVQSRFFSAEEEALLRQAESELFPAQNNTTTKQASKHEQDASVARLSQRKPEVKEKLKHKKKQQAQFETYFLQEKPYINAPEESFAFKDVIEKLQNTTFMERNEAAAVSLKTNRQATEERVNQVFKNTCTFKPNISVSMKTMSAGTAPTNRGVDALLLSKIQKEAELKRKRAEKEAAEEAMYVSNEAKRALAKRKREEKQPEVKKPQQVSPDSKLNTTATTTPATTTTTTTGSPKQHITFAPVISPRSQKLVEKMHARQYN